jgi:hypothetical protein
MDEILITALLGTDFDGYQFESLGYVGSELKKSYYDQSKLNLEIAASKKNQLSLFD